jgi:hypothetical protein
MALGRLESLAPNRYLISSLASPDRPCSIIRIRLYGVRKMTLQQQSRDVCQNRVERDGHEHNWHERQQRRHNQ